jgi:hypothetical protein
MSVLAVIKDCMVAIASWIKANAAPITAIAASATAIAAWKGLRTWKKQIKGKKEYDLALRLNIAAFKLKIAIKYFRESCQSGIPPDAIKDYDKKESIAEFKDKYLAEKLVLFEDVCIEATMLWGNSIEGALLPLDKYVRELFSNSWMKNIFQPDKANKVKLDEIDKIIYGSPDDEFGKKVEASVENIKEFLKKYL